MAARIGLGVLGALAHAGCGGSKSASRHDRKSEGNAFRPAANPLESFVSRKHSSRQLSLVGAIGESESMSNFSSSEEDSTKWSTEWKRTKKRINMELEEIKNMKGNEELLIKGFSRASSERVENLGEYAIQYVASGDVAVVFASAQCLADCSSSHQSFIVKYQYDCSERLDVCDEAAPGKCELDTDELTMEYILTKIVNENSNFGIPAICPKMIFLSDSVEYEKLKGNQKTNFQIRQIFEKKCDLFHSRVRFLAEEKVGSSLAARFFKDIKEGTKTREKINYSVSIFTQLIQALEQLHTLGVIHGDIHNKNVAFRADYGPLKDKIILIDFGVSKFFPDEIGSNENAGARFTHRTLSFLSVFELANIRSGRRDDVSRAFEIFVDQLTGRQYSTYLQRFDEERNNILCVKSHLPEIFIAIKSFDESQDESEEKDLLKISCYEGEQIPIPNYPIESIWEFKTELGELKFSQLMDILATLAEYFRGGSVSGTKLRMHTPDSVPDYAWIIKSIDSISSLVA